MQNVEMADRVELFFHPMQTQNRARALRQLRSDAAERDHVLHAGALDRGHQRFRIAIVMADDVLVGDVRRIQCIDGIRAREGLGQRRFIVDIESQRFRSQGGQRRELRGAAAEHAHFLSSFQQSFRCDMARLPGGSCNHDHLFLLCSLKFSI